MRAGCEGGGKGALISNERSLTLAAAGNDQAVFTDRHWDNSGVNPTLSQCGAPSGTPGSSNQELFAQNFNELVAGMESGAITPTLQANLGKLLSNQTPIVLNDQGGSVMQVENDGNAGTLRANTHGNEQIVCVHGAETPIFNTEEFANPITENHGGLENCVTSQCGTFLGQMGSKAGGIGYDTEVSPTVNVGQLINCVCYENHANDSRVKNMVGVMGVAQGVGVYNHTVTGDIATTITANSGEPNTAGPKVMTSATVRRLLPIECERLMGFPDNWTRIPWKGKPAEDCPDSPRYKACGNSMCVNVMRWLGLRIELVERRTQK
jgi:DNA (cytosine-5)-methyltransferase 1